MERLGWCASHLIRYLYTTISGTPRHPSIEPLTSKASNAEELLGRLITPPTSFLVICPFPLVLAFMGIIMGDSTYYGEPTVPYDSPIPSYGKYYPPSLPCGQHLLRRSLHRRSIAPNPYAPFTQGALQAPPPTLCFNACVVDIPIYYHILFGHSYMYEMEVVA